MTLISVPFSSCVQKEIKTASGRVLISVFDILPGFDCSAAFPDLLSALPAWRLQKVLAYRFDLDRFLCAKSFLMLQEMLGQHYGIHSCPAFSLGPHGKPYLEEYPDIHFNMSHCRKGVACAVSDHPIGIDIEEIQYDECLADRVLNSLEKEQVENSGAISGQEAESASSAKTPLNRAERFTEFWTRKESLMKLSGEGMTVPLKDILSMSDGIEFETFINRAAGYVCTTAAATDPSVCHRSWR